MKYWNSNRKSCEHVEPREDWKESIELWIDWMEAIGRTEETLRTRWYQIVRFSKIVNKSITDVTEDDLIFYLAGMGTEGRRGVRSCVKVFYQWSMKRGLARCNPADEVPTVPMTLPSGCICPEENIEQGLASPDENARLAVMLGAFCGLRRIEMTRINLKTDLEENAEGMVLHVHGKGNKERILPVPARLAATLRKRTGVWLFPGDVQGHCGVDYVAKRIKTATGYPSHSLRRRFATCVYYRNGCNIVLVSRMLGHANIATTMRYIGLVQDEMRNAVESTTRTDMRLTMPMNQVVGTAGSVATYSLAPRGSDEQTVYANMLLCAYWRIPTPLTECSRDWKAATRLCLSPAHRLRRTPLQSGLRPAGAEHRQTGDRYRPGRQGRRRSRNGSRSLHGRRLRYPIRCGRKESGVHAALGND